MEEPKHASRVQLGLTLREDFEQLADQAISEDHPNCGRARRLLGKTSIKGFTEILIQPTENTVLSLKV